MKRDFVRERLDITSVWALGILTVVSVATTCILALLRSPRLGWMIVVTLASIFLNGVNRLRVHARVKLVHGKAIRKRRKRVRDEGMRT